MNRKYRLLLVLLIALVVVTAASVLLSSGAGEKRRREEAARQHSIENQKALNKTAEFLKPDTSSDIRFGKAKSHVATQQPTPTPTTPR